MNLVRKARFRVSGLGVEGGGGRSLIIVAAAYSFADDVLPFFGEASLFLTRSTRYGLQVAFSAAPRAPSPGHPRPQTSFRV